MTHLGSKQLAPSFPGTVWDGKTLTRLDTNADKPPDAEDFNRLATELIATQQQLTDKKFKQPVRAATVTYGTLATDFRKGSVVDGVTLATGDRILIKDGTPENYSNGIYVVNATGAPTRALDSDSIDDILGTVVWVEQGGYNGGSIFKCTNTRTTLTVFGLDSITFDNIVSGSASFFNLIATNILSAQIIQLLAAPLTFYNIAGSPIAILTNRGAFGPGTMSDANASNGTVFIGSDHSNKLCFKDASGTTNVLY